MHGGHALLRLHRLHHLLLRLLGDGGQRLLLLWRQGEGLQVIAARLGLQVRVVEQEALLLLEFGDLPIDAHRAEPAPGERRRVLEALEDVPGGNLLLGGHLKALTADRETGRRAVTNQALRIFDPAARTSRRQPVNDSRTSFSKPAILLPLVSMREPCGSQVMTSRVCLGSGRSWRTLSRLSDCRSPSSFCGGETANILKIRFLFLFQQSLCF